MFIMLFLDNRKIFLKVKEKSAMDDKIFDFAKTKDALSQLSADLIELDTAIKTKQTLLEKQKKDALQQISDKEIKIADLGESLQRALDKIDQINRYIEEAL